MLTNLNVLTIGGKAVELVFEQLLCQLTTTALSLFLFFSEMVVSQCVVKREVIKRATCYLLVVSHGGDWVSVCTGCVYV